ncbi:hypothetical protein AVEN_24645-1 [Araneus ventricosus]|uniref:Uncharacterized protein n=1 Tax=Araneus ventricosus TaxID=182803 RepID=A0A4Y2TEW1_ARAVE|nr:hypothetical protein AVEN_24645-1 [Araneus ventricosus]
MLTTSGAISPFCRSIRGRLKNSPHDSPDTKVEVLIAITNPTRKRYVPSSVQGYSSLPLLYPQEKPEPFLLFRRSPGHKFLCYVCAQKFQLRPTKSLKRKALLSGLISSQQDG